MDKGGPANENLWNPDFMEFVAGSSAGASNDEKNDVSHQAQSDEEQASPRVTSVATVSKAEMDAYLAAQGLVAIPAQRLKELQEMEARQRQKRTMSL